MPDSLNIKADITEAKRLLEELDLGKNNVQRKMLSATGQEIKKRAKSSYSQSLNKRTGKLYKSLSYKVQKKAKGVTLYSKAVSTSYYGKKFKYANALAGGPSPKAKNGDYLTFQIGDKWVKVHSVRGKEHDLFGRPTHSFLGSPSFDKKMKDVLEKEIERCQAKATGKK